MAEKTSSSSLVNPEESTYIRPEWDDYFLLLAKLAASRSTCLSRAVGAVIVKDKHVLTTGYNGSLPGQVHCTEEGTCFRRSSAVPDSLKYEGSRSIHAEMNAIAQAAKQGITIDGATLYVTLAPCIICIKLLVNSGIRRVVYETEYESIDRERDAFWRRTLYESGLEVLQLTPSPDAVAHAIRFLSEPTSTRNLPSI